VRHIAGNLHSRFTDFLTSDGEKPWRDRDTEFMADALTREQIEQLSSSGWEILFGALGALDNSQLTRTVRIRGKKLLVIEALHRSLAHVSCHVGQMLYLGKSLLGDRRRYLSIPPGGSAAYNQNPALERGLGPSRAG
jgi:hypothetical protein